MKNITKSMVIIGAVAALAIGGTIAYFSDTEQSTGNTFTAGTIDIAVDNQNPWSRAIPFKMEDMKPSQVDYTNFTIQNVGTNPVNVWKKVDGIVTDGGTTSEPECDKGGGNWINNKCTGSYTEKKDLENVIQYDLSVVLKDTSEQPKWNQTLYNMNKTIADINAMGGDGTFLGMIPEGWSMDVTESYHMNANAGNEYQGDKMTFNITLTGEQLKGVAVLEDKDPSNWRVKSETAPTGTLTYGVKDSKFNFSFSGVASLANTSYSLITYPESFSVPAMTQNWPRKPITILATASSDGGKNITIPPTSTELNSNLLNMKIWLVKSSDVSGDTMSGWNSTDYLFDTGLIDYYDSDL